MDRGGAGVGRRRAADRRTDDAPGSALSGRGLAHAQDHRARRHRRRRGDPRSDARSTLRGLHRAARRGRDRVRAARRRVSLPDAHARVRRRSGHASRRTGLHRMQSALRSRALGAACWILLAGAVPATAVAAGSAPSPSPSPSPAPSVITHYDNYLGKIVAHAGPREGYTLPIAELARLGARTIGDVLRFVPGVVVRQAGTAGALQTVALRGDSASQTLILLDGRPVNEGDTGITDFTSMPLDGVERISVIEGGLSSRYGSGAIGGVVEILTTRPLSPPGDSVYAQIGYEGEFASGAGVTAAGPDGGLRIDAFTRSASNTFDYPGFESIPNGTRTNNDLHASDVTLCACLHFGRRFDAALHVDDNTSELGAPGSTEFGPQFTSVFARQQRDVERNSLNLTYASSNASTSAIFYVDGRRLHFYDTTPSQPATTTRSRPSTSRTAPSHCSKARRIARCSSSRATRPPMSTWATNIIAPAACSWTRPFRAPTRKASPPRRCRASRRASRSAARRGCTARCCARATRARSARPILTSATSRVSAMRRCSRSMPRPSTPEC